MSEHTKITSKADDELLFYRNCPVEHRPKGIVTIEGGLAYYRESARHPTTQSDWDKVYKAGCDAFWLGLDVCLPGEWITFLETQKRMDLRYEDFHPVRILHGCPRAEHILMTEDICFISPRKAEVVCREWDEAYILMSIVTLWESWTRNWHVQSFKDGFRPEIVPPFEVTDVHKMFLLRHWKAEITRTEHLRSKVTFMIERDFIIKELEKDWNPVDLRATMIEKVIA